MNVLQNLTELYNSQDIDSVYRDLALKILGNLDQMRRVTIYDIADLTNSSRTTIWRLVQKLGYESFSDFRYALQSAASQYVYYNRMIEQRKTASGAALLNGLSRQLSDTNKLLSQSVTAEEIDELTTSFVYSFQQNLWIDGKNSEYQCLLPQMLSSTRYLDDRSIVLISTIEYAETLDMTRVFETIKEKGSTIWLSGNTESRYADYADRQLLVSKAPPAVWIIAFELFILALSERYRSKFIDK